MEKLINSLFEKMEDLDEQFKNQTKKIKNQILRLASFDFLDFWHQEVKNASKQKLKRTSEQALAFQLFDWLTSSNWVGNNGNLKILKMKTGQLVNFIVNEILQDEKKRNPYKLKNFKVKALLFEELKKIGYI